MNDEPAGFAEFVRARGLALRRTALLLTQDAPLAEDLVQTALAKAWPRWSHLDNHEAYVRRVMVHQFYRDRRRRWHGETPTEVLPEHAGPDPSRDIDQRDVLQRALATLTPKQRAVIVLRYFHDLSERQIADALGVSPGTVKSQTSRALVILRESDHLVEARDDAPRRTR
ncbi:SigE family RNA polymerase sigma factor [Luteipulveratus flavus]|uniref:SigE family RNA polymerase sigma factor n=1 Tax=Luteipulveratus flavus TaxID=3031728 RepID=A0ABT6CAM0_9MICO|nr:SigE family RNA polymerase sigma factor [Luteipulveratus sp. YIM 133296]MDF8265377.1 SigE family RNA polymerase sigma factor [Luteipulveratus sp. YIM 133296]